MVVAASVLFLCRHLGSARLPEVCLHRSKLLICPKFIPVRLLDLKQQWRLRNSTVPLLLLLLLLLLYLLLLYLLMRLEGRELLRR